MTYLTSKQVDQLLAPIAPQRVLDLKGLSYVAQQDIRAHMNRIFGFGRWSTRVIETEFIFEEQNDSKRWIAGYRATVEVEVFAPDGTFLARYQDSHASGNAPQPQRAEAHALALTTAVSTAFKRACTNLGDQFGLSLYNKGQRTAIVKGVLIHADDAQAATEAPVVAVQDIGDEPGGESVQNSGPDEAVETEVAATDTATDEALPGLAAKDEVLSALRQLITETDARARIAGVAAVKATCAGTTLLTETVEVGGESLTLGLLADKVAAGAYSPSAEKPKSKASAKAKDGE